MRFSLLALAALLFAAAPRAQVYQGLVELGGSASFQSTEGNTVFRLAPALGYFFTDALEAGVRLNYVKFENVDGNGTLFVFGAYHFGRPGATTVPFLEANLGTSITDDSDLVFGGRGGAKFFFLPGGALTADGFVYTTGDVTTVGAEAGVSIFL
ncbi:hypothetical protein [Rubrivirga marina]|uniref:Outer membrane protein beta-barrel domain-containing protein n=1 Tax=Rubrivirga marina TaxID=1196024 RepID=A0A271IZY9_9BACT|nr:hypothetical protein [Rubrivirga marina]PAP76773.1 hypothetical protein BSZ37_10175 [Rubrivirga marina]